MSFHLHRTLLLAYSEVQEGDPIERLLAKTPQNHCLVLDARFPNLGNSFSRPSEVRKSP